MKIAINNPDPGDIAPGDFIVGRVRAKSGGDHSFTTTAYHVRGYVHAWVLDVPADDAKLKFDRLEREVAPPAEVGAVIDATVLGGKMPAVRMMLVEGEANCDHDRRWWRSAKPIPDSTGRVRCSFRPEEIDHFSVVNFAEIPF